MASAQHMMTPAASPSIHDLTFTERVGLTTRWGRYLTSQERQAVDHALQAFAIPTDAVEVGCQGGRWSELLAARGWRVTCTDVDHAALNVCQRRLPNARCVPVEPEDLFLPCETASKDLLLCIEVFPVIHCDWFAREAERVLRTGGMLVGVFLNRLSLRGAFVLGREKTGWGKPSVDARHLYCRSYKAWKQFLEQLGFELQFERGFCWFPFSRRSDSPLVPACTLAEQVLGLRQLASLSPWVAFVARKRVRHHR